MSRRAVAKYFVIPAALIILFITSIADAQPIAPSLYTRVRIGATNVSPALAGGATQSITFDQIGTDSVPLIAPTSWALDPLYSGVGQGSAYASYGSLAAYSHVERTSSTSPNFDFYYFIAQSNTRFSDNWTIDSPGLTGTQGSIAFDLSVEGNLTGTTNARVTAQVTDVDRNQITLDQSFWKLQDSAGLVVDEDLTSAPMNFTYGTPFNFSIALISSASSAGAGWATSDCSNTMILEGIELRDSRGNVITDYALATGSGTAYFDEQPEPVPEPATMLLIGSGLLGMAIRRFKK